MSARDYSEDELSAADRYLDLWERGDTPPDLNHFLSQSTALDLRNLTDVLLIDQSERWAAGKGPLVEEYLLRYPELASHPELSIDLIYGEFRSRAGEHIEQKSADLEARFPEWREQLRRQFEVARWMEEIDLSHIQLDLSPESAHIEFPISDPESAAPLPYSDYQLEQKLGAGAMGEVYRATQKSLGKRVAIKILGELGRDNDEWRERFFREARMVARLHHPHIVDVHGLGRTDDKRYFLVMDYVDGQDLDSLIRQGTMSTDEAVPLVTSVAAAIDHAHARGIIHRDIKPGNILLDSNGHVRVTDFGLSLQVDAETAEMSTADQIIGTPQYMAPEQADRTLGPIDARTDVYGLGGLLFALLTGEPPVVGANKLQVFAKLLSAEPNRSLREINPEIPAALDLICRKALAKAPGDRYQSAREFEEALLHSLPDHYPAEMAELAARAEMLYKRPYWIVPSVILTMCLPLLIVIMMSRPKGFHEEPPAPYVTESALAGEITWRLSLFTDGQEHQQVDLIDAPLAAHPGDSLQFRFQFEVPVYPYLFWIDSDEEIHVLHAPRREDIAVKSLSLPAKGETAYPMKEGSGTELLLMILRSEPVADPILLTAQLTKLPTLGPLDVGPLVIDGQTVPYRAPLTSEQAELIAENLSGDSRPLGPPTDLKSPAALEEARFWIRSLPRELGELHFALFEVRSDDD